MCTCHAGEPSTFNVLVNPDAATRWAAPLAGFAGDGVMHSLAALAGQVRVLALAEAHPLFAQEHPWSGD